MAERSKNEKTICDLKARLMSSELNLSKIAQLQKHIDQLQKEKVSDAQNIFNE